MSKKNSRQRSAASQQPSGQKDSPSQRNKGSGKAGNKALSLSKPDTHEVEKVSANFQKLTDPELRASHGNPVETGQLLLQAKEILGHGNFLAWLQTHFKLSIKTANRFMAVAQMFQQLAPTEVESACLMGLDPSALYELAAKSTPESLQRQIIAQLVKGENLGYTQIKQLKELGSRGEQAESKLLMRYLGLLEAFSQWFDQHRTQLPGALLDMPASLRQEYRLYARNLKQAAAQIEHAIEGSEPEDGQG